MAETKHHLQLKRAAVSWALQNGYDIAAEEIRVPKSNFRADAVACKMARPDPESFEIERTAIFECKQSRADFLNDAAGEDSSRDRLVELHQRRAKLEQLLGLHYPNLRNGDSLFPEYQQISTTDFSHAGYQSVMREISTLERAVFHRTKLDRMIRYRSADLCYLVVMQNVVEENEVPTSWGILQWNAETEDLEVIRPPNWLDAGEKQRLETLYQLARRGSLSPATL